MKFGSLICDPGVSSQRNQQKHFSLKPQEGNLALLLKVTVCYLVQTEQQGMPRLFSTTFPFHKGEAAADKEAGVPSSFLSSNTTDITCRPDWGTIFPDFLLEAGTLQAEYS